MYKKDYIVIQNLSQFLIPEIPTYHPDDPRHTALWKNYKKMCIEGIWGEEFGRARHMPGRLLYYGNFCSITDTDKEQKIRRILKPRIDDIEWERSYMFLEAEGFSGWSEDDVYTSDVLWFEFTKGLPATSEVSKWDEGKQKRFYSLINQYGKLKQYKTPRQNIRQLHEQPLGRALFWNECQNIMEFGGRGGGKSFWYALGGCKYTFQFGGVKQYTQDIIDNPPKAEICVGSGKSGKVGDFMAKIVESMNEFAFNPKLGVWGKPGDEYYEPSPFFMDTKGSAKTNNKEDPWRHKYDVKIGGRWVEKGTGSYVNLVTYSPQARDGAEAAAGGRYLINLIEECGLTELVTEALSSGVATVNAGFGQFGIQIVTGTSGNMVTVLPSKEAFTHPRQFRFVTYQDEWEATGEIAFFLPAYMTNRDFKDENGNTQYEEAIEYYDKRREIAAQATNPYLLAIEKMNYPNVPSDMWQTEKGYILPVAEAQAVERNLMEDRKYERMGTPVILRWDANSKTGGVTHEIDMDADPFFEPAFKYTKNALDGAIMIYEWPRTDVPSDYYCHVGHDPHIGENPDEGESLGVTYVVTSAKYLHLGLEPNKIVASYIGKPYGGTSIYYENQEKLLAYYGCPSRSLWYESDRGDKCKAYYDKKNKLGLLSLRPQREKGANIYGKPVVTYGYQIGNKTSKLELLGKVRDHLLDKFKMGDKEYTFIERIPCIFLIRQIIQFNLEGNFDAVMAYLGSVFSIKEAEHFVEYEKRKQKHNSSFLSMNRGVFRDVDRIDEKRNQRINERFIESV